MVSAVKLGDPSEIDALGDWLAQNFFDAGRITAAQRDVAVAINWGTIGNTNPILIPAAAAVVGAIGIAEDAFNELKQWAESHGFGQPALDALTGAQQDSGLTADFIEFYLSADSAALSLEDTVSAWQSGGYNYIAIDQYAQQQANLYQNDPQTLVDQVESSPLSFLPPLDAPTRTDYADGAVGDAAFQAALDRYNIKFDQRTQVQTLYDQFVADTNALTPLPVNPAGNPGTELSVITGDANGPTNDDIFAGSITTQISGLLGADTLSGRAGVEGSVEGIQILGGAGNDVLYGEFYQGDWAEPASAYFQLYHLIGTDAFTERFGAVKPGLGAFLFGEAGNDTLQGSLLDDTLDGGADADYLIGYLGNDVLIGGAGNDIYYYRPSDGHDDILDIDGRRRRLRHAPVQPPSKPPIPQICPDLFSLTNSRELNNLCR